MSDSDSAFPGEDAAARPADSTRDSPSVDGEPALPVPAQGPYVVRVSPDGTELQTPERTVEWYRAKRRRQFRICLFLFVATLISTTLVGSGFQPLVMLQGFFDEGVRERMLVQLETYDPSPDGQVMTFNQRYIQGLLQGFSYSGPLMLILLCHEMGHFLQAVKYRVPASYPFFIPLPIPPLGTMGAVIAQGRGVADRKQMFDIAVSGPLAGLVVTLPILYFGVRDSTVATVPAGNYLEFGEPLIIEWFIRWLHGPLEEGQTLMMNGVAHAGWVGVFVTALNLIPVGQLDGGHLTYTLLGRPAHWIALLLVGVAATAMILTGIYSYSLFLILIMMTGARHPPTRDDTVPLGPGRHILGWCTLAFLLIGFTPTPIIVAQG